MTHDDLTDFFAGLALQALVNVYKDDRSGRMVEQIAKSAYVYADAMMEERKRRDFEERTSC
jgi:hypothetical protein